MKKFVLLTIALAVILSPFASSYPDGLEWISERFGFITKEITIWKHSLFPDYTVPLIKNSILTTSFSGLIGLLLTFGLSYLLLKYLVK